MTLKDTNNQPSTHLILPYIPRPACRHDSLNAQRTKQNIYIHDTNKSLITCTLLCIICRAEYQHTTINIFQCIHNISQLFWPCFREARPSTMFIRVCCIYSLDEGEQRKEKAFNKFIELHSQQHDMSACWLMLVFNGGSQVRSKGIGDDGGFLVV